MPVGYVELLEDCYKQRLPPRGKLFKGIDHRRQRGFGFIALAKRECHIGHVPAKLFQADLPIDALHSARAVFFVPAEEVVLLEGQTSVLRHDRHELAGLQLAIVVDVEQLVDLRDGRHLRGHDRVITLGILLTRHRRRRRRWRRLR